MSIQAPVITCADSVAAGSSLPVTVSNIAPGAQVLLGFVQVEIGGIMSEIPVTEAGNGKILVPDANGSDTFVFQILATATLKEYVLSAVDTTNGLIAQKAITVTEKLPTIGGVTASRIGVALLILLLVTGTLGGGGRKK